MTKQAFWGGPEADGVGGLSVGEYMEKTGMLKVMRCFYNRIFLSLSLCSVTEPPRQTTVVNRH